MHFETSFIANEFENLTCKTQICRGHFPEKCINRFYTKAGFFATKLILKPKANLTVFPRETVNSGHNKYIYISCVLSSGCVQTNLQHA